MAAVKKWLMTTWIKESSGEWDVIDSLDVDASEVAAKKLELAKLYGEPKVSFGQGGSTVTFHWEDKAGAHIELAQKSCA